MASPDEDDIPPPKCECPEHANHERWVISYADFVTLLFALFVVLYASSVTDLKKLKRVRISMGRAFGPSVGLGPAASTPAESPDTQPDQVSSLDAHQYAPIFGALAESLDDPVRTKASLAALKRELDRALAATGLRSRAKTGLGESGLVLAFNGDGLFLPGGAELVSGAATILKIMADHVNKRGGALVIEAAINRSQRRLGAAREGAIIDQFTLRHKVAKEKVVSVGRPQKTHAKWGQGVKLRIMLIAFAE